jgi:hypothetical protein
VLTHIAGGKVFGDEDEIFQSLNEYVIHESGRMIAVFKKGIQVTICRLTGVIDIMEPEEHFAVDQYDDLASTQKPTLTIRQSEVKWVHAFVSKELEIMVQFMISITDTGTACPGRTTRHRHSIRISAYYRGGCCIHFQG